MDRCRQPGDLARMHGTGFWWCRYVPPAFSGSPVSITIVGSRAGAGLWSDGGCDQHRRRHPQFEIKRGLFWTRFSNPRSRFAGVFINPLRRRRHPQCQTKSERAEADRKDFIGGKHTLAVTPAIRRVWKPKLEDVSYKLLVFSCSDTRD